MTDPIDERLIAALRDNGRASTAELARQVGRSRTSVQSRLTRLERQGVILGYTVRLAPDRGPGAIRAHVMIKVGPKEARAVDRLARGDRPGASTAFGQRRCGSDRHRRGSDGRGDGRGDRPDRRDRRRRADDLVDHSIDEDRSLNPPGGEKIRHGSCRTRAVGYSRRRGSWLKCWGEWILNRTLASAALDRARTWHS